MKNIRYLIISTLFIMLSLNIKAMLDKKGAKFGPIIKVAMSSFLSSTGNPVVGIPTVYLNGHRERYKDVTYGNIPLLDRKIQFQYMVDLINPNISDSERHDYVNARLSYDLMQLITSDTSTVVTQYQKTVKAAAFIGSLNTTGYTEEEKTAYTLVHKCAEQAKAFWQSRLHLAAHEKSTPTLPDGMVKSDDSLKRSLMATKNNTTRKKRKTAE